MFHPIGYSLNLIATSGSKFNLDNIITLYQISYMIIIFMVLAAIATVYSDFSLGEFLASLDLWCSCHCCLQVSNIAVHV